MMDMKYGIGIIFSGWVFAALLMGCDSAEQQQEFQDQAFVSPSGFTHTNEDGEILEEDADDWRTSPIYTGRIVIDPAFPNPVPAGAFVTIPVRVREFQALQGSLDLVIFDTNRIARRLDDIQDARDPGAYVFTFNPKASGITGLTRVYIVDNLGGLISYGDLSVK